MRGAKRPAAVVAFVVMAALISLMVGLLMNDGDWGSVLPIGAGPVLGACGGLLIRYWWEGRRTGRREFPCRVRLVSGERPPLTGKWTPCLAMPRAGRLALQPRASRFGPDSGDVIQIGARDRVREREPTWPELLLTFTPFCRILRFETADGLIEMVAGRADAGAARESITVRPTQPG